MENIREKIKTILETDNLRGLDVKCKEVIIETLGRYYEVLIHQYEKIKCENSSLEAKNNKYEVLFDSSPVIFVLVDDDWKIVKYNQAASEAFGQMNVEKYLDDLIDSSSRDTYNLHIKKLIEFDENVSNYVKVTRNETLRFYKMVSIATQVIQEKFYQCAFIDLTQEKLNEEKANNLSFTDELTGLYNRRFFSEEIHRLDVERNFPIGIIIADINGLKLINDTFGHQVGDELLILTGNILKNELRDDEILTRLGGDEFAVVLSSILKRELLKLVKRLEKRTSAINVKDLKLSIAFGYAVKDKVEQNIMDIIKEADDMMYRKKIRMRSTHHKNIINSIVLTLNERHPQEKNHSERVKVYLEKLSEIAPYNSINKQTLITAALLYDIGNIAIDNSVLDVERSLSHYEYLEVMKHPAIGYQILKSAGVFNEVLSTILHHHEKYDGTGYPYGLKGEQIPIEARMLTVCDAYDAMLSERPYRKPHTREEAINELRSSTGTQFDPDVVQKFVTYVA